jgi:choline-sulfatase
MKYCLPFASSSRIAPAHNELVAPSVLTRKFVEKFSLWDPGRAPLGAQCLSPRRAPWAKLCRSFGAAFFNEPRIPHTSAIRRYRSLTFALRFRGSAGSRILKITSAPCLAAVLCCLLSPCAKATPDPREQTPVILISIDTLRADHLGAYGYNKVRTPYIDSFAKGGTLFTQAEAQIPLTLPSHTSLFTSTYPFQNRVEENGERVPTGVVTLASVLRAHGYKTAAFLASDFLGRRYRLDPGFDVYDSPFDLEGAKRANPFSVTLRRDGALVVRAARQWIDANRGQAVFVFLHLYDLHVPYTLPEDVARGRGISRYDAQLEYVDQVLGRFKQALVESGAWERSLVVLLSDHGEGLGDHQETDHGYFIYESTLHVPLIIHWPSGSIYPAVARVPAGLIDVAPTILAFLRIPAPPSFEGKSQLSAIKTGEAGGASFVYSESMYAYDAFRWAPLRALRVGKYKVIQAPKAELYDLVADPHEQHNVILTNSALAAELQNQLGQVLARYAPKESAPPPAIPPETLAQLESIGYLAAEPGGQRANSGIDPKDRLREFLRYQAALLSLKEGHAAVALPEFRRIVSEDPQNTLARFYLGECYRKTQQPEEALEEWTALLKLDPAYAPAAEAFGQYWLERGEYAKARLRFAQVLVLTPNSYTGHLQLAIADEHLGLLPEAYEHLKAACKIVPYDENCARELNAVKEKMK